MKMKPTDALAMAPDPDLIGESSYRIVHERVNEILSDEYEPDTDAVEVAIEELKQIQASCRVLQAHLLPLVEGAFDDFQRAWEKKHDNEACKQGWSVFGRDTPNEQGELYEVQRLDMIEEATASPFADDDAAWAFVFQTAGEWQQGKRGIAAGTAITFLKRAAPRTLAAARARWEASK